MPPQPIAAAELAAVAVALTCDSSVLGVLPEEVAAPTREVLARLATLASGARARAIAAVALRFAHRGRTDRTPPPDWWPALADVPALGRETFARAVLHREPRAQRILAAAARETEPLSPALCTGLYRLGWALGHHVDPPDNLPAPLTDVLRRAQSAAGLTAEPADVRAERAELAHRRSPGSRGGSPA